MKHILCDEDQHTSHRHTPNDPLNINQLHSPHTHTHLQTHTHTHEHKNHAATPTTHNIQKRLALLASTPSLAPQTSGPIADDNSQNSTDTETRRRPKSQSHFD